MPNIKSVNIHLFIFSACVMAFLALSSPASACACCDTYRVTNVAPDDTLNVRTGPGVRYSRVGSLRHDDSCIYKTRVCKKRWCKIEYGELKGWVHTYFLKKVKQ